MAYSDGQSGTAKLAAIAGSVLIVGLIGMGLHDAGQITPSPPRGPQWITAKGTAEGGITTVDYNWPEGSDALVVDQSNPLTPAANSSLPRSWPGNHKVYWGQNYQKHNSDSKGLWILDATKNNNRKVFRVRPAGGRTAGEMSAQTSNASEPAATVFLSPGSRINIYLPPGLYEVYAASGDDWEYGPAPEAAVVSYGFIEVSLEQKALIIPGAIDQEVRTIPRSWF